MSERKLRKKKPSRRRRHKKANHLTRKFEIALVYELNHLYIMNEKNDFFKKLESITFENKLTNEIREYVYYTLKNDNLTLAKNIMNRSAEVEKEVVFYRNKHVSSRVKETPVTKKIINHVVLNLGRKIKRKKDKFIIISGYLSYNDLLWKINYHWDYLYFMLTKAKRIKKISKKSKMEIIKMLSNLNGFAPNPKHGYRKSSIGKPFDKESKLPNYLNIIKNRRDKMKVIKNKFNKILLKEEKNRNFKYKKSYKLAVANVLVPSGKKSKNAKHLTGYAIDIAGNNKWIKMECKKIGATMTYNEGSHIHVEFENNV